ncbi:fumarylpyruvate hydrolase [Angomonas deanei]|nr:fumarylpyruvate hydrolase [Angomonas deanei]|eukprot:EPY28937.1 fumarylpyruvate hydrolase [Angomonas deanei]
MSSLAFTSIRQTVIPIVGKNLQYPVRRVYCVGQNYEQHAREMQGSTNRANPFFFSKNADDLVVDRENYANCDSQLKIRYPSYTESLHHEVELVVAIGPHKKDPSIVEFENVDMFDVHNLVYGYAVGLDMTRRDLQLQLKAKGHPWEMAKAFDDAAVISSIVTAEDLHARNPKLFTTPSGDECKTVEQGHIFLQVNNTPRQDCDVSQMVTPIHELVAILSKYVTLRPGDLLYTGTPSGVGPVRKGDEMEAGIEGLGTIKVSVV